MDFNELYNIKDEYEQINRTYDIFCEDKRLSSKSAKVEFLTTVKYIEKYLKPGMKILDIGAGTGVYSLYFAEKGYEVSALELADNNVSVDFCEVGLEVEGETFLCTAECEGVDSKNYHK